MARFVWKIEGRTVVDEIEVEGKIVGRTLVIK